MNDQVGAARAEIARACGLLSERGLVLGTAGNVSVRVGKLVAVTATGARFDAMTPAQVTVLDLTGAVVEGTLVPTSEVGLHLGVYSRYPAQAVVHTHAPAAVAVGLVADELPCVHYQLLSLGGAVPVAPYATFGTPELADGVLAALEGRSAALMAHHGAVTLGATLDAAVEATLLLEWACEVYLRAAAAGTPRALDAAAQEAVVLAALSRSYGAPRPVRPASTQEPS